MQPDASDPDGPVIISNRCLGEQIRWLEAKDGSTNKQFVRKFSIERLPNTEGKLSPLIIYAHPDGENEQITPAIQTRLGRDALLRGFAFMSIETRHPTSSQCYYPIPQMIGDSPPAGRELISTDIATAVQFARYQYKALQIDPDNIFLVGQSRGSAVILNALIADQKDNLNPMTVVNSGCGAGMADPVVQPYTNQLSKPNAVFAVQAQVTYDNNQIRDTFVEEPATATVTQLTNPPNRPPKALQFPQCVDAADSEVFHYKCHYDRSRQYLPHINNNPISALDALNTTSLNRNAPPIWLRYDKPVLSNRMPALYVNDAGDQQDAVNIDTSPNCFEQPRTCLDVHHPVFGKKLVSTYKMIASSLPVSSTTYVYAQYGDAAYGPEGKDRRDEIGANFYKNYVCFFLQYKRPDDTTYYKPLTDGGETNRQATISAYNNARPSNSTFPKAISKPCTLDPIDAWYPASH